MHTHVVSSQPRDDQPQYSIMLAEEAATEVCYVTTISADDNLVQESLLLPF